MLELLRLRNIQCIYRFEGRFGGAVEFGVARLLLLYTFYIGAYFVRHIPVGLVHHIDDGGLFRGLVRRGGGTVRSRVERSKIMPVPFLSAHLF